MNQSGDRRTRKNKIARGPDIALALCWVGLHNWQHTLRSRYVRGAVVHCERCGAVKRSR
jgi:hypothetical protein